ncbi:MAG: hypothetical protein DRH04_08270 [Deltaproteobacteria bacterium]|nr:MAG: hypothetical protein DRH04_08270 [Deltaproteobacteria bacterium]
MREKSFDLHLEGIGTVCFHSSSRARRLSIAVVPFRGVRVSVPLTMSLTRAEQTVRSRKLWISKHQERVQKIEKKCRELLPRPGSFDPDEARESLISRLQQLAEKHGLGYSRVAVRRQRTRWGSCSAANAISLNVKLALLPDELRDLVLIHELVHTKVKNHGRNFWQLLEKLVPGARDLDRQLKTYSGLLFLP